MKPNTVLAICLFLIIQTTVYPQPQAKPSKEEQLRAQLSKCEFGTRVMVRTASGEEIEGKFGFVDKKEFTLLRGGLGPKTFNFQQLESVKLKYPFHDNPMVRRVRKVLTYGAMAAVALPILGPFCLLHPHICREPE